MSTPHTQRRWKVFRADGRSIEPGDVACVSNGRPLTYVAPVGEYAVAVRDGDMGFIVDSWMVGLVVVEL